MATDSQNPNGEVNKFPQFDTVTEASDHKFLNSKKPYTGNTQTSFYKTIMKEWKILEKNLPPSIYVRIYENRIDLLSAVIIGAAGTPYHDGLFFFDFAFPEDYPNKPPLVHYKSFGLRLNPNLYSSGYVCLSLLNTWSGPRWQPNGSTVLQVLVSIQGLVLNAKPFFNEPIYAGKSRSKMFDKMSKRYNNDAFALSCKTMMYLLIKPPNNFKGIVVEHFRDRGRSILTACKAYMNGFVRVGDYQVNGSFLPQKVRVSKTFLSLMEVQYPKLVNLFVKNDPSLSEFLVQLDEMVENTLIEYEVKCVSEEKKRGSWFSKMFCGLNKCIKGKEDSCTDIE